MLSKKSITLQLLMNEWKIKTEVRGFSPSSVRKMLRKICRKLELPNYRLHEFRHTFVSNLIRAGVPLPVVASVSGDLQTTLLKRHYIY